jgi:hypothetical protein
MDFKRFKVLHNKYSVSDWNGLDMSDFSEYTEAMQENKEFHVWAIKSHLEAAGFDYNNFCCITMANNVFLSYNENGEIDIENHDVVINKWKDGTYGIPIHDGGSSVVKINYCPWCGSKLNKDE